MTRGEAFAIDRQRLPHRGFGFIQSFLAVEHDAEPVELHPHAVVPVAVMFALSDQRLAVLTLGGDEIAALFGDLTQVVDHHPAPGIVGGIDVQRLAVIALGLRQMSRRRTARRIRIARFQPGLTDIVEGQRDRRMAFAQRLAADVERAQQQVARAVEIAARLQHPREGDHGQRDVGMFGAQRGLHRRQRFAIQRLGRIVFAQIVAHLGQIGQHIGDLGMLRRQQLSTQTQRLAQQRLRTRVIALAAQDHAQVAQRVGDAQIAFAVQCPIHRQRFAIQRFRAGEFAAQIAQPRQVGQRGRDVFVILAERRAIARQRIAHIGFRRRVVAAIAAHAPLAAQRARQQQRLSRRFAAGDLQAAREQRFGAVVHAQLAIRFAHRIHQFDLHIGLAAEFAFDRRPAAVQQLARGELRAAGRIGIRALEYAQHQRLHLQCLCGFGLRAVAFARQRVGLDRHRHRIAGDHRDDRHACRHRPGMPADELAGAITPGFRARAHRSTLPPAFQVLDHRDRRRIAALRFLAQRLQHDIVEIAAQLAPQRRRRGLARGRGFAVFGHALARAHRLGAADRVFQCLLRHVGDALCALAGQQFVEQQAELIDIGRGRCRLAVYLLRRGVVGREHPQRGAGQRLLAQRFVGQRLGDAEIQQLRLAVGADDDIAGLDVAMRDQIAVRVRDRLRHLYEQRDALIDAQPLAVAGAVDRFAFDIFHHQIRPTLRVAAAVEQPRDAFVIQRRQDLSFLLETAQEFVGVGARAQQFHRAVLAEPAFAAFDEIHRAHAAAAQRAQCVPHADPEIMEAGFIGMSRGRGRFQSAGARCVIEQRLPQWLRQRARRQTRCVESGRLRQRQQFAQFGRQRRFAGFEIGEKPRACVAFEVQRLIEQRIQTDPRVFAIAVLAGAHSPSSAFSSQTRARIQSRCTVRSELPMASAVSSSVRPAK